MAGDQRHHVILSSAEALGTSAQRRPSHAPVSAPQYSPVTLCAGPKPEKCTAAVPEAETGVRRVSNLRGVRGVGQVMGRLGIGFEASRSNRGDDQSRKCNEFEP